MGAMLGVACPISQFRVKVSDHAHPHPRVSHMKTTLQRAMVSSGSASTNLLKRKLGAALLRLFPG